MHLVHTRIHARIHRLNTPKKKENQTHKYIRTDPHPCTIHRKKRYTLNARTQRRHSAITANELFMVVSVFSKIQSREKKEREYCSQISHLFDGIQYDWRPQPMTTVKGIGIGNLNRISPIFCLFWITSIRNHTHTHTRTHAFYFINNSKIKKIPRHKMCTHGKNKSEQTIHKICDAFNDKETQNEWHLNFDASMYEACFHKIVCRCIMYLVCDFFSPQFSR